MEALTNHNAVFIKKQRLIQSGYWSNYDQLCGQFEKRFPSLEYYLMNYLFIELKFVQSCGLRGLQNRSHPGSGQIITSCALLPSKEDVGSETVKALTQVASLTTFFRKLPENA